MSSKNVTQEKTCKLYNENVYKGMNRDRTLGSSFLALHVMLTVVIGNPKDFHQEFSPLWGERYP